MRSVLSSDMHRGAPDSSHGSGDQYCFSGSRPDPLLNELSSGKNHKGKCRRLLKAKVRRNESQLVCLAQNVFSIGMIHETKDTVPDISGFDSISQADHFACKVTT